jgi:acyl-CoA synthetase (NDP forming)
MLDDPNVDLLLCPITGALPSMANKLCEDIVAAWESSDKPILVVWGSPVGTEEAYTKTLLESTVPTFRTFSNAVIAAKAYFDHHRFAASYHSAFTRPVRRPSPARAKAMPILLPRAARRPSGDVLSEQDSKALLKAYGIGLPRERIAASPGEAAKAAKKIGFPVVMKIVSPHIPHKSDLGLVAVGVRDEDDARRTYKRLVATAKKAAPKAAIDGVLIAEMVKGVETVVGIARDDLFGPVVMFGLGGVLVEVLRDVTFRVPPFTARDATAMLGELRGAALLRGVRGQPAADRAALADVIMKMQRLAVDLSHEVAEVDINPLLAGPHGAVAADALVVTA